MFVGRVIGNLVSTCKHRALDGARLLWVERLEQRETLRALIPEVGPVDSGDQGLDGGGSAAVSSPARKRGKRVLAFDTVDAAPGDRVLVLDEGNGASQVLGRPRGPVRTVIVGVIDQIDWTER
jgi:microcompartment protein CcmK/EutM